MSKRQSPTTLLLRTTLTQTITRYELKLYTSAAFLILRQQDLQTRSERFSSLVSGNPVEPQHAAKQNSSLPDGGIFSNDALPPPEVKFTPQNLQLLFFECRSLIFFLLYKPLWELLTLHGLKIFSQYNVRCYENFFHAFPRKVSPPPHPFIRLLRRLDNLRRIVQRLPFHLRTKFFEVADTIGQSDRRPNITDISAFEATKARATNNPVFGSAMDVTPDNKRSGTKSKPSFKSRDPSFTCISSVSVYYLATISYTSRNKKNTFIN